MVRLAAVLPTSRRAATKMALRGENINRAHNEIEQVNRGKPFYISHENIFHFWGGYWRTILRAPVLRSHDAALLRITSLRSRPILSGVTR